MIMLAVVELASITTEADGSRCCLASPSCGQGCRNWEFAIGRCNKENRDQLPLDGGYHGMSGLFVFSGSNPGCQHKLSNL